ncbi:MAG: four helix bundle protein [Acidobacteriales bacterium]|nr:four helix bundle protein [Terriglobales bacterium]
MRDFKDLKVWDRAHQLTLSLYSATQTFPREELFGLTSQMRRAAASIGANLAEGCGRKGDGEMARFVQIAMGSASELEYHLLLARDLKLIQVEKHSSLASELTEIRKMLSSLSSTIGIAKNAGLKLRAKG